MQSKERSFDQASTAVDSKIVPFSQMRTGITAPSSNGHQGKSSEPPYECIYEFHGRSYSLTGFRDRRNDQQEAKGSSVRILIGDCRDHTLNWREVSFNSEELAKSGYTLPTFGEDLSMPANELLWVLIHVA